MSKKKDPQLIHSETCSVSIVETEVEMMKDGRNRGVWFAVTEDPKQRSDRDTKHFIRARKAFFEDLQKKIESKKKLNEIDIGFMIDLHFNFFAGMANEWRGALLEWPEAEKYNKALTKFLKTAKRD